MLSYSNKILFGEKILPTVGISFKPSNKPERYKVIEFAWGKHQVEELSSSDLIKRIRAHSNGKIGGDISYNDIKQSFCNALSQVPTIEIRKDTILISIHPVTAIILYDRLLLKITSELNLNEISKKLDIITQEAVTQIEEVKRYYERENEKLHNERNNNLENSYNSEKQRKNKLIEIEYNLIFKPYSLETANEFNLPMCVVMPLEMQFLEFLMGIIFQYYNNKIQEWNAKVSRISDIVRKSYLKAAHILEIYDYKEPIQYLKVNIDNLNKAIDELIDSDERIFTLQLTKLYFMPEHCTAIYNSSVNINNEEFSNLEINPNLEVLLEHINQEAETVAVKVLNLNNNLLNLESLIHYKISVSRNSIQIWEVACTMMSVGVAISTSITGAFGMNFRLPFESSYYAFYIISIFALFIILISVGVSKWFKQKYGL